MGKYIWIEDKEEKKEKDNQRKIVDKHLTEFNPEHLHQDICYFCMRFNLEDTTFTIDDLLKKVVNLPLGKISIWTHNPVVDQRWYVAFLTQGLTHPN